jgi:threonyl-tRNA synthetase
MAEIFAYAVLTLFPDAKLIDSEVSDYGFSYNFILPYPEVPLEMIEDRLLQLRIEDKVIESKVMMPLNAASMFDFKKQQYLAKRARESKDSLLSMMQIDEAFFICPEPFFKTTKDILYFKLLKIQQANGVSCIDVAAFEAKDELKKFLKNYDIASKLDGKILAKELALFIDEGFLPRGATLRRILINHVEKMYDNQGFKEIFSQKNYSSLVDKCMESKVFCLHGDADEGFVTTSLLGLKDAILSILQFIEKNIKLLSLEYKVAFVLPKKSIIKAAWFDDKLYANLGYGDKCRVDFSCKDALGRFLKCAYLEIDETSEKVRIKFSLLGSIERFIHLLLERYAGDLPLWLAPEQVWLIPVSFSAKEKALLLRKKLRDLGVRVFLNDGDEVLKNKIHSAQARKIPYLCVIGDKEVQANTLSIRNATSSKLIEISEGEFAAHILKKLEENFESQ